MANFIKIKLKTQEQPDCCSRCPLIGIVPEEFRQRGTRQSYCCLGVYPHEALTSKGIDVRASDRLKTGHKLHRPCDDLWDIWWQEPDHCVKISKDSYRYCRMPYENRQQLAFVFKK